MTDPLADQLAELAPAVDTPAAHDAFVALRSRRRRRRRWITGAVTASIVIIGGTAIALVVPGDEPDTVATTARSSPTATSTLTATGVDASGTPTTPTEPSTVASTALLAVDGCTPIAADDLRTSDGVGLFGRETPAGVSIQAVATPAGVEGPYVAVLRYRTATRNPTSGDPVDVNGHRARLFVGDAGQGQLSWLLDDGSEAHLRSRGLGADQLLAIAEALAPRADDASVVGFDLTGGVPGGFALVAETVAPVTVTTAMTTCQPASGADLRVGVVDAPLAAQYAIGVDQLPLPALRHRGEHLVWAVSHDPAIAAAALGLEPPPPSAADGVATTLGPVPNVTFTIERSAVGQAGCTAAACRFADVTLDGFAPGSTVTVECHSATYGPFGATDITIGAGGAATQEACYFGWPGERFWVTRRWL